MSRFPDYLQDLIRTCGHKHATIRTLAGFPTARCPICTRRRKANPEPTPRSLDPEPWATGYGEQRARDSRRRGVEKSAALRRAS